MPRYVFSFCGKRFNLTADSPKEAREKGAKRLSKIGGVTIPPSAIYVYKRTLK